MEQRQDISTRQQMYFQVKDVYNPNKSSEDGNAVIEKVNAAYRDMCFKITMILEKANIDSNFYARLVFSNNTNPAQVNEGE